MTHSTFLKTLGAVTAFTAIILLGMTTTSSKRVSARDDDHSEESKVQRGFQIAPVHLNMDRKNRELVGLGSYIVNAVGDCNGCHSAGPQTEFASPAGNPYFRKPPFSGTKEINQKTYLGGGRDFGQVGSVPHIYSRNLTPDKTGRPAGGLTYPEFVQILRTGVDLDHVHPNCSPSITTNCFTPPFNGDLLQVMRWPFFQDMTDHDLRAIYEYLSAVPCNPGQVIAGAPYLQNECE